MPDLSVGYFSQTIIGTQDLKEVHVILATISGLLESREEYLFPFGSLRIHQKQKPPKSTENIARTDAEYYTQSIAGNYQSLLDEYSKFSSSIEYYEKQAVPEANIIIEQANLSFKAGALDYLEYVLTLNRASDIRQNYLDALNNCNQTIISIEYITGKIF